MKSLRRYPAFLFIVAFASAGTLRADVIFAWHDLLLEAAANSVEPLPPQIEARIFAMVHVAIDEAVAAAAMRGEDESSRLNAERAAATSAAHATLVRLMPRGANVFDALANEQLNGLGAGPAKERGLRAGHAAADRIVALRETDRWMDLSLFNPLEARRPESLEVVSARLAQGQTLPESSWLQAKPFGLKSVAQFSVREVRSFNRNGTQFVDYQLANGSAFKRVDQRAAIQRAPTAWTARPLLTWNRIAREMCAGRSTDLSQQARLLAALNVAIADATLASLHWSQTVGNWRVVMAEQWQPANDSLPRALDVVAYVDDRGLELVRAETQHILVPPTAHYPSPAATVAGAAQAALESFFRTDRVEFGLPVDAPPRAERPPSYSFSSISAAARECAFVASLNGPHTREACVAGYFLGQSIGNYTSRRFVSSKRIQ